jgi:hypothetical protein
VGAIEAAAGGGGGVTDACAFLLDVIRREFPTAETIPSWNDSQSGPRLPLRMLDRAAQLAHNRNL